MEEARLSKVDFIFGTQISLVKTYATRYQTVFGLCILLDIIVILVASIFLFARGSTALLFEICMGVAVAINMMIGFITKSEYQEVFLFYLRNKNKPVSVKTYLLDQTKLFSVLFCSGYKRVQADATIDTYIECLNSACIQSRKYSRRIVKYLREYEDEEGNIKIVICDNKYFVSVKEDQ